jgi:hypothetical protein
MEGIVPQGAGVVSAVASAEDCTGNVTVIVAEMEGPEKGAIPLKFAARIFPRFYDLGLEEVAA